MTENSKTEFRKHALQTRRDISLRQQKHACIRARLTAHPQFQSAEKVMIYINLDHEVETRSIVDLLFSRSKSVYIPYCNGSTLGIFELRDWNQLEPKSFGLLEPKNHLLPDKFDPNDFPIELALVPGVAFDLGRNRLGYGRGYYDQLLSVSIPKAYRIALAYSDQIFDSVPTTEHDIPMDEIITETGIIADHPPTTE